VEKGPVENELKNKGPDRDDCEAEKEKKIVSPSLQVSPIKTIESLWPNGLPIFEYSEEGNTFFQTLMGLWNNVASFRADHHH
jgi:hypothetical protein